MSHVDNVLESNNLLLTTKYSTTASSSSSEHVDNDSSHGNLNNSITLSTVTDSNPVSLNSQSLSDDDSSGDDMFDEWVKSKSRPASTVIYGPTVPFPHLMMHYKVDTLIKKLKVDPGIPILHVPSKRSRSVSKASGGAGKLKKKQKAQGSTKEKVPLYSQSTPLVGVPSYRQIQNSN